MPDPMPDPMPNLMPNLVPNLMSDSGSEKLTHLDDEGRITMVDVSAKPQTARTAEARGAVRMASGTVEAIRERRTPKGDPLETARLAAIMAAKRTAELIPLCHSLALTHVDVRIEMNDDGAEIFATASTSAQTGVEMEALTAVSVAALTIYDMCKAIDRRMVIDRIRIIRKTGGKSGNAFADPLDESIDSAV